MTGQIVIRSSPVALNSCQPLLASTSPAKSPPPPRKVRNSNSNVGEVAGGTAADVFIVCCCCPCVVFEFLILALCKVPATVVRRMWKKQRHKMKIKKTKKKKTLLEHAKEVDFHFNAKNVNNKVVSSSSGVHYFNVEYSDEVSDVDLKEFERVGVSIDGSAEVFELDQQMWDRFRNAGFWRSPSQRFEFDEAA